MENIVYQSEEVNISNERPFSGGIGNITKCNIPARGFVWLYQYPTNNCQVGSISDMQVILNHPNPIKILNTIFKNTGYRPQYLFDIKSNFEQIADLLFKEDIVFKQPYVSTNGSNMIMYLIRCDRIFDLKTKDL